MGLNTQADTLVSKRSQRFLWISVAGIFVIALGLRIVLWPHQTNRETFDEVEVVQTAMSFAHRGYLGDPYVLPTGPSAHVTPAFPFLIGLAYRYAPDLPTGEAWKNAITMTIACLQFALLPLVARSAGLGILPGVVAGLLGAGIPMVYLDCSGDFEAPLVGLALVDAIIVVLGLQRWRRQRVAALLTGLMWGLTALISAQLLLCGVIYELVLAVLSKSPIRLRASRLGLVAAGVILGVLPWTVRNYIQLGAPVISRDNAGLELDISNSDESAVSFDENLKKGVLLRHHPHVSAAEAMRVRQLGEIRYNQQKKAEAMRWIQTHPGRFAWLTAHRIAAFWFPPGLGTIRLYLRTIVLLGLIGLWLSRTLVKNSLLLFVVLLVAYPLPHYIVQASERYRYPLDPVLLLFTGVTLVRLAVLLPLPRFTERLQPYLAPSQYFRQTP